MTKLKAGVVGAGVFGGNHARKYQGDGRVELVGLFDVDSERAQKLASDLGVRAVPSIEALLADLDVITIATPPSFHAGPARAALEAGKHVLIEKPLAVDVADGEA